MKTTIGLAIGDACGIGPELVARIADGWARPEGCRLVALGNRAILEQGMRIAGRSFAVNAVADVGQAVFPENGIDVLEIPGLEPGEYELGRVDAQSGDYTVKVLRKGLDLCVSGALDGLVYAPLNKAAFKEAGHDFPDGMKLIAGHIGWNKPYGEINIVEGLWTARVTGHVPLARVCESLTTDAIVETIMLAHKSIAMDIAEPRLAVAGVNPHNGENGLCGREELDIVAPAVERARSMGVDVRGPFPADTVFARAFAGEFDMVITMYHDQGQIAMKLKDFAGIVTLVGGMDIPIATPAHGTAFDIAGKGGANPGPIEKALELVCRMAKRLARAGTEANA